ncbi:MAG TPA: hypothetical protein VHC97_14765 [Thermoanaerobaculia bacterium]|jgi:hypothetical protein|nr:hypothetical protein [Thermoanaerobaculia bacterium]
MKALTQDLRYACRLLLRSPGFTLLAAVTLALGIGANAAIFSVADSVLLKPLPDRDSGRLMIVYSQFPTMGFNRFWVDPVEFTEFSRWNRSFQALGAYVTGAVNMAGQGEPVRADAAYATAGLSEKASITFWQHSTFQNTFRIKESNHSLLIDSYKGNTGCVQGSPK